MKIEKRKPNTPMFKDLKVGDVFEWSGSTYMKLGNHVTFSSKNIPANSVDLETGLLLEFCPDSQITPLKAYLLVEETYL